MKRDYKHEAAIETPKRKAERAARNRARRIVEKAHGPIPKGMQVDHKSGSALNNKLSNLRVASAKANNTGRRGTAARVRSK